jgi:PKD repeat protein
MKSNILIRLLAGVLLLCMCIGVVSASTRTGINQGATVFIGEQGLDITRALNEVYGNANLDGYPVPPGGIDPLIAYWTWPPNPMDFHPDVTIDVATRFNDFDLTQAEFQGRTSDNGRWYAINLPFGTGGLLGSDEMESIMQRGEIFTVADPYITILTLDDSSPPQNVNGKSVSRGDLLTFRIDTNMNLIYNGLRTVKPGDIDQNMNIKVRNPVGTTFTSLYDSGLTPQPIINQYVNVDPWFWFVYWATGAQVTHPDYYYQGGTYTIWAESTLNGMKDNYLDTGHTYWGKTASLQHQVTLVAAPPPTADFTANPRTVTTSQPVEFTDASPGSPTGWAWFFGDESYTEAWTEQSASAGWTAGPGSDSVVLPDGSIVLVRNGVWRSTDQGISWTPVNPSPGFSDGDTVVMPDGTMLHMNYGAGMPHSGEVWRSSDKGTTWIPVTMTTNRDSGSQYTNLEDCVALPDGTILLTYYHLMAGDWTGLMRSMDQGVTWTTIVSVP